MSEIENPPAFPSGTLLDRNGEIVFGEYGMSLRDWLAGQAIAGGLARQSLPEGDLTKLFGEYRVNIKREEIIAVDAYRIADAMLAERAGKRVRS